jgi:nitrogen regulatory protein P-II 1
MKKIECIIKPEKFEELKNELRLAGIGGMTISDVRGFGAQTSRPDNYLILPKIKIEMYCTEAQVSEFVAVITKVCRTGDIGNGKIAILPVENIIRVRTGEQGDRAIV